MEGLRKGEGWNLVSILEEEEEDDGDSFAD